MLHVEDFYHEGLTLSEGGGMDTNDGEPLGLDNHWSHYLHCSDFP